MARNGRRGHGIHVFLVGPLALVECATADRQPLSFIIPQIPRGDYTGKAGQASSKSVWNGDKCNTRGLQNGAGTGNPTARQPHGAIPALSGLVVFKREGNTTTLKTIVLTVNSQTTG